MSSYVISPNIRFLDQSLRRYTLTIHDLPSESRPREKLLRKGPGSLSVKELLAVILVTGTVKEDILEMTERLVKEYGEKSLLSFDDAAFMSKEMDIPLLKACQIVACGELGRRIYEKSSSGMKVIKSAKDVYDYLNDMRDLPKEHLRGLYLNSHNKILKDEVISIGTVDSNIVHPREVFRPAIECNAVAVVLAHNHPSQESEASDQDREMTKILIEAGKLIGIPVLDHVIITKDAFTSVNANY